MLPNFELLRPTSLDDAVALASGSGTRVHSGGTDLLGCLRDGVFSADRVIALSGLPGLRGIEPRHDGGLRIGALTPVADVAADPTVRARFTVLAQAAGAVGSPQLRNRGTLGGNLCQKPRCWYYRGEFHCLRKGGEMCYAFAGENQYHCIFGGDSCYIVHPSDPAPALVALDALVRVQGPGGSRLIPVAKLHVPPSEDPQRETVLAPGEILTEVVIPAQPGGLKSSYRKVRARRSWDFALAGVALALAFDGRAVRHARVVLSGVAPIPWRLAEVEQALIGKPLDAAAIAAAAELAVRGAEPLSENAYKVTLVRGLVEEQLAAMA